MADKKYIEVNAVKRELVQLVDIAYGYGDIDEDIEEILDGLPAADVAPVVHAEWNKVSDGFSDGFSCSRCGYSFEPEGYLQFFRYCPLCGAKMDGGEQRD